MSKLELISYAACPFAQRTRMVLIEKGVDFTLTELDLSNKPDWFDEISPYGKVPVIRHDGQTIYESAVINEYLEEVFPEPLLMPLGAFARAEARIWMHYCDAYYLPASSRLSATYKNPEKKTESVQKLEDTFRFIEIEALRKLSDGPYWFGEKISLVDTHYSPFLERFAAYDEIFGVSMPVECTRIRAWLDAMASRQSFQDTTRGLESHIKGMRRRLGIAA